MQYLIINPHISRKSNSNLLRDYTDGSIYKENPFFNTDDVKLELLLYQDCFSLCNPLGAAKKKKILAVYMLLGNLPIEQRSKIDNIQLVLLCEYKHVQSFGMPKIFECVVEDLKKLEIQGINIEIGQNFINVKGTMFSMLGDNLGSHEMLGLSMNFSSRSNTSFWCRYCYIIASDFNFDPLNQAISRNKTRYVEDVSNVSPDKVDLFKCRGQKEPSILNELIFYHTTSGLPPCLGHDLFEGVIHHDLLLFIKYFIKKKWISLNFLNFKIKTLFRRIFQTTFPEISIRVPKIVSKACDSWKLIQIFPLAFINHIKDDEDVVWMMVLLLKKITELVCSQVIYVEQTFYLDLLVEEYLYLRAKHFPDELLRPKHHYLSHYGDLTRKFGPLIRLQQ